MMQHDVLADTQAQLRMYRRWHRSALRVAVIEGAMIATLLAGYFTLGWQQLARLLGQH